MRPSKRLERIPPYAFAELERKIARKRKEGVDVISLGIGDPDRPTPALIVEAMQEAQDRAQAQGGRGRDQPRHRRSRPPDAGADRGGDAGGARSRASARRAWT